MAHLEICNRTNSSRKLQLPQQKEPDQNQAPITSATREDEGEDILAGTSSGVSVASNCSSRLKQMQVFSNSIFGNGGRGSNFYGNQPVNHENRSCAVVISDKEHEKKSGKRKDEEEYENQILSNIFHEKSALAEVLSAHYNPDNSYGSTGSVVTETGNGVEPPQRNIEGTLYEEVLTVMESRFLSYLFCRFFSFPLLLRPLNSTGYAY